MHPQHQLGIGGGIRCSRRETTELRPRRPLNLRVHGLHELDRPLGLLLRPEGDQVERAQRVDEAPPKIMLDVGVIADAGGHEWMGHLEQYRRPTPQERDEWRVAESPDHAFRREIAVPASQPLRMGGCARISAAGPTLRHPHRMPKGVR